MSAPTSTDLPTPEALTAFGAGRLPGLIGIRFTHAEPGLLRSELTVRPELLAPNGFLHAASVVALADTTCGYGTRMLLPPDASGFTTIELKSNHLGTAREGTVTCEARKVHAGRTTQVWDAEVTGPDGRLMALFRCTQAVLYPKPTPAGG
ncbi:MULTISPECIES: PaaI family thioesterase [unclassified Deinococcus]|uniref:PaaI family thioesterase n=1 Tax=unclassified Deinococcus TaxID=2623546 RepID=UPI001C8AF4DC|nr:MULTISPECIES: PaaI family thioesterase [unclassified Deinococcus]MBX8466223.1 PaaI family thioesterase [Deinococcus sp. RIT780]MCD0161472.1 PaaI family thioesterase [Deinococcus sp. 6YEL10]